MNKQKLYQQIQEFKNELARLYDKKNIKEVEEFYYYVSDKNAQDKAEFIKYLIEQGKMSNSYNTILDLAFGSGNLTSHIVCENDIEYERLILNDENDNKTNQNIINYIDNCEIEYKNMLKIGSFRDLNVDLVIVNPQVGGYYEDCYILKQKIEDEKEQDVYDKLGATLKYFLGNGATVLFYGKEKDFKSILSTKNYIKYNSKLIDIFVVSNNMEKYKCFEKSHNDFIQCINNVEEQEKVESFDEIEVIVDTCNEKEEIVTEEATTEKFTNKSLGSLDFPHKNLLLKGVPGTGKSTTINQIIYDKDKLKMQGLDDNVLRINIHSASSNSDLMQGISITTDDKSNIIYAEKRGAVLKHIFKAIFKPKQPFVLVLEEVQENSLNELIGDLIYLIEKDKRTTVDIDVEDDTSLSYSKLLQKLPKDKKLYYVELPSLVEESSENLKMIIPNNLYIFCTSNYRDDKKVIEDNLLRRFDVVEIYPKYYDESWKNEKDELVFKSKDVSGFLSKLNELIEKQFKEETHPDRYLVGHANWLDITEEDNDENKKYFYTALLKVLVEFKEIREVDFDTYVEPILSELFKEGDHLSERIKGYLTLCDFEVKSYKEMVDKLQVKIYDFLKSKQ